MGATVSRTDFTWSSEKEPHAARRKEILGEFGNDAFFFTFRLVTKEILGTSLTFV